MVRLVAPVIDGAFFPLAPHLMARCWYHISTMITNSYECDRDRRNANFCGTDIAGSGPCPWGARRILDGHVRVS